MRKSHKIYSFLVIIIVVSTVYFFNTENTQSLNENSASQETLQLALVPHSAILITNDGNFTDYAFAGSGSAIDPYIIENLEIITTEDNGINIIGTTAHFIVRNCYVDAISYSIKIESVSLGTASVINNTCNGIIYLYYSDGATIINNTCTTGSTTLYLYNSNNAYISNNYFSGYNFGISALHSESCTFINNTCINISGTGIYLYDIDNSTVTNNNCIDDILGIYLQESSSFNNISNNFLKGNDFGISIENSEYNIIYHNDFIENNLGGTSQSRDEGSNNSWYNVSISEGNYWSDWDGIGSYVIDSVTFGDVVDLYPLAESDGDGMPNDWEEEVGTDPYVFDSHLDPDNDGLDNLSEYLNSTHPFLNDSDSDGLSDGDEVLVYLTSPIMTDSDSDGLDDFEEIFTYFTNATNEDTDGDGMTDGWEAYYSLNPLIDDSALDLDDDGLTNIQEFIYGTDPSDEDTDEDTLLDYDEIFVYFTNALNPDTDGDMLTDGEEVNIYGTSPLDEDSDNDGLSDGEEVNLYLTDPLNEDSDGDGYPDGEEVDNGYDPLDPKSNYSRYRTSQILMYVLYSVLSVTALVIIFIGQKYLRRYLLTKSIKQQGFQSLEEMQTAQNRGFRTKSEFDEANSSGFVNFDEYNLAKALDLLSKSGLISTASADVEQVALQIQSSEKRLKNLQEFIHLEYDIGHLAEYETTIHEIESSLKKAIISIESYNKIEDKQTQELVYSILLLGNRILTSQIPNLQTDLNVRKDYLKSFGLVVDLTKKFHPQVPVSLERIVSLANLSQEVVIAYLKDITTNMPQIGNYLELEQVFIRQYSDNQDLKTFYNQTREKYREKIVGSEVQPACVYCKNEFDEIDRTKTTTCQNCGKEAPICPICKQSMFYGEDLVREKNCGNIFHKNHIVMWIRSEELCPICKKRINENSLEPYE